MTPTKPAATSLGLSLIAVFLVGPAAAEPLDASRVITIGSALKMTAPKGWVRKTPRVSIITHEFAIPAVKGDPADGRMTVMRAGGSVDANIQRWYGQFTQPDGSKTADRATTEKIKVGDNVVHLVDVSGTYRDARGPFAPAVMRPDYRMLAAIIATDSGNQFVKLYGPKKTMADSAKAFRAMVEGME